MTFFDDIVVRELGNYSWLAACPVTAIDP